MIRLLLLLALSLQCGQAQAHAALVDASPADGATLTAAPEQVRLRFDEPVGLIAMTLTGPAGAVAFADGPVGDADVVRAGLPTGLPDGTYLLSWRVTSADSHPVAGTVAFGVGVSPQRPGTPAAMERWLLPSVGLRAGYLFALLVGAGGALFRLLAEPPARTRRVLAAVAWAGAGLAVAQLGVRGALLVDAPTLLAAAPWMAALHSTLAASLGVGALGLIGCAMSLPRGAARAGAIAAVVALGGLPLSSHAVAGNPRLLMALVLVVHGLCAAFWAGAFWPLLGLLRGGDALAALRRFSDAAQWGVLLLVLSGAGLFLVQVPDLGGLTGTTYGRFMLVKLGLVAVLLGFAGWNKATLTPALAEGESPGRLRTSIRCEIGVAAAIVLVTATLSLIPPARTQAAAAVLGAPLGGRAVWTVAGGLGALVEVTPGRPGRNEIAVSIDRPTPPREVWLELRLPAAGVAAVRRPMRLEAGRWVYAGPEIAIPGRWTVRAEALLTEFDQATFTTEIDVR